jgi:hypothetical protein
MGLVRAVLIHAARKKWIHHVPEFPRVGVDDRPRGWFKIHEYKAMYKYARKIVGKTVERVRAADDDGNVTYHHVLKGHSRGGDKRRSVKITDDLREMIVFMVNSIHPPHGFKEQS